MSTVVVVFVVQIVAGSWAQSPRERRSPAHSLGMWTEALMGVIGGIAAYGLYAAIPAMVNGGGAAEVDTSFVNEIAVRALAAFIAGGILSLIVACRYEL